MKLLQARLCLHLGLFIILSIFSGSVFCDSVSSNLKIRTQTTKTGIFDQTIKDEVLNSTGVTYLFTYEFYTTQQWAIYVCVKSPKAKEDAPLLVSVRQSLSIMSWTVPLKLSNASVKLSEVCHTLCPLSNYYGVEIHNGVQNLFIDFTTNSPERVPFELVVSNLTNFLVGTERTNISIAPSKPRVLEYHLPAGVKSVLVEAKSLDEPCMILAIQDIQCPFYDSERTVEYKGFYQTMTHQSGITVTRSAFKEGKVYIVMILKPTNEECTGEQKHGSTSSREKEIEVNIAHSVSDNVFYAAIFGAFAFYLLLYIFSFIICCLLFVRRRRRAAQNQELSSVCVSAPSVQVYGSVEDSASSDESDVSNSGNNIYIVSSNEQQPRRSSQTSIDETDFDKLPDAERDKDVVRTKTILYVADLSKKKDKYLSQRTKVYSWNLVTVAVFYGLPVVQLVYINQKIVNLTGNQDLCYYNFLCSHKTWVFSDFNHVYSNIGYAMLGLLFLLLVWRREKFDLKNEEIQVNPDCSNLIGIPHHFGLFYAMGWALVMEGVLSASYHVCPNKANFQFDTAFMYVIATVCMLKLYQGRHPDITAKSHQTWMILSVVLLIGVAGVLQGGTLFWIAFVIGHITITFLVSTTIYYMGRWKLDRWICRRIFQNLKMDLVAHSFRPTYLGRFIMLSIAVALNVALDLFGLIKRPANFGAFLLAVFIMNLMLYLIYYTIMKLWCKERIRWIPAMYIILSFVSWAGALHFFLSKNTSWQMTPAGSRDRNKHCIFLNFYDHHDIWHFLSSCALFFSYMVLFTLDDDLEYTPRASIRVF